ncbi:MAG: hypothetical protein AAF639_43890 [Chloroflexota bacterium]
MVKTARKYALPIVIILIALAVINLGLYFRLAGRTLPTVYNLPYYDDFAATQLNQWYVYGGNWRLAEGVLRQENEPSEQLGIVIPLKVADDESRIQSYRISVDLQLDERARGAGILFGIQHPQIQYRTHVVQLFQEQGQLILRCGYMDENNDYQTQAGVGLDLPLDAARNARMQINVDPDVYSVQINNQLIVQDVPIVYKGGWVGLNSVGGPVAFDNIAVESTGFVVSEQPAQPEQPVQAAAVPPPAVPPPTGAIDINTIDVYDPNVLGLGDYAAWPSGLPYIGDPFFRGNFMGEMDPSLWRVVRGDWLFANDNLVQTDATEFDQAIIYQNSFDGNYMLRTIFRHLQGVGAGVLFNLPNADSTNGGHLVRFTDDNTGLFWADITPEGEVNGQGYAPVGPPGTQWQVLDILMGPDSYALRLNGNMLAANVPLTSRQGYVGFTTSQSTAAYGLMEGFGLTAAPTFVPPTADTGLNLAELDLIQGIWTQNGNVIVQEDRAQTDFPVGTGVSAERYTVNVDITLPDEAGLENSGAGILFHMSSRNNINGANMVRFQDGGNGLIWGYFDDTGNFVGQGFKEMHLSKGEAHKLSVAVDRGVYNVQVNDEAIVSQVNSFRDSGWIGLTSFRGPVQFSNFQLSLRGIGSQTLVQDEAPEQAETKSADADQDGGQASIENQGTETQESE